VSAVKRLARTWSGRAALVESRPARTRARRPRRHLRRTAAERDGL